MKYASLHLLAHFICSLSLKVDNLLHLDSDHDFYRNLSVWMNPLESLYESHDENNYAHGYVPNDYDDHGFNYHDYDCDHIILN